jgi:hypothetical protein
MFWVILFDSPNATTPAAAPILRDLKSPTSNETHPKFLAMSHRFVYEAIEKAHLIVVTACVQK